MSDVIKIQQDTLRMVDEIVGQFKAWAPKPVKAKVDRHDNYISKGKNKGKCKGCGEFLGL